MVADESYALTNLLAAGTVQLYFESETIALAKPSEADSDDWDALTPFLEAHQLQVVSSSLPRLQEVTLLVRHRFLRATWSISACHSFLLHVRIYLIPFDLPGVRGKLVARNRDEHKILLPARKALFSLLSHTNVSALAWAGCSVSRDDFQPFLSQRPDVRTLSEIYSDLPSPTIDLSTFLSGADPRTREALRAALRWESPPGMRPLYAYQRRTVARMLQQELDPGVAPDPSYIPIHGVQGFGKTFYLQPSTMEILNECPMRSQARGGILCEEMGTGKTCIVLGLITATKHQISSPEEAQWGGSERPVLTPIAFRHFPGAQFERARQTARVRHRPRTVPSLVEMLTHFIRAYPSDIFGDRTGFNDTLDERPPRHLRTLLKHNHPFYHVYERVPETSSPRRKALDRGPRKVYLTSATLVIVPRTILEQWNSEINKHCEGGSLRVLALDMGPKAPQMPSAQELASKFDVVLLTHEKFSSERSRCDPSSLYTWTQCQCSVVQKSRVPYCICHSKLDVQVSPLIQIRWKRLVVDEGHVSAAANNLARLCQELNVERRWIVSGTPTRNLMGLSLGQSERPDDEPLVDDGDDDDPSTIDDEQLNSSDDGELVYPSDSNDISPRVWTRVDRDDLAKLGEMISKFIGVPQFAHGTNVFRKMVAAPLLDPRGPCYGAIQVLSQVMTQVMIRHQIRDVERELPEKLPPLKHKTVALKFHPLAAKTYNIHQSFIAINAVDSERTHQDYLFHTSNRGALRQTLENLTQTMFWRTDESLISGTRTAYAHATEARLRAIKNKRSRSDIKLIKNSIRVLGEALHDAIWKDVMHCEDNPFVVRGLSPALQGAWLKMDAHLFEGQATLLDADRLCKLRDVFLQSPFVSEHRLIEHGLEVAAEEARVAALYEESQRLSKRKAKHDDGMMDSLKVKKFNVIEKSQELELHRELTAAIHRRKGGDVAGPSPTFPFESAESKTGTFPSISIGISASAKVNYILRKVLKHAAKHKYLIFSAFPMSLAHVEDALRVAQVPYLKYTSGIKPHLRQHSVVTFETSEKYRVLLTELKLGARGLNLVTASRIIFCEPVWQGDIESQAIKRAHRIGQRCKELKVATLVMRGTSEEAMVTRRHILLRKSQRLPAMEEDASLSKFLQNPTFIGPENIESPDIPSFDIPLVPGYVAEPAIGQTATAESSHMVVDGTGVASAEPLDVRTEPVQKKRKLVHFA